MRKAAFIIFGVVIGISIGIVIYFKLSNQNNIKPSLIDISPTPKEEELISWIDQAEFSFQYPKSLNLNPHEEDQENYAHVELTSDQKQGSIIVWVKDTDVETINDWVKQKKIEGAIDTVLGGEPAKKILTSEDPSKIIISSLYGGYLYQIEVNLGESDFWHKVADIVASSFKFISEPKNNSHLQTGTQNYSNEPSEADYIEEEETIE